MYCSLCGNKYSNEHNYCPTDGGQLSKIKDLWMPETSTHTHCRSCGQPQDGNSQYCETCGTSAVSLKVHVAKTATARVSTSEKSKAMPTKNKSTQGTLKEKDFTSLKVAGISFAAVFFIVALLRNTMVTMTDEFRDITSELPLRVSDTFLFFHAIPLSVHNPEFGLQTLQIGFYAYLLLAAIIFTLTAWFISRKIKEYSLLEKWKISLLSGVFYGIALSVTSLFTSRSVRIDAYFDTIQIHYSYSFFQAFFIGFIMMSLFSLAGMMIAKGFSQSKEELGSIIPYGGSLLMGAKAFLISLLAITIVFTFYVYQSDFISEIAVYVGKMPALFLALQATAYILSLVHLQSFQFYVPDLPAIYIDQSFWLFSSDLNALFMEAEMGGVSPFVMAGVLIPIGLFIWIGIQIKARYGNDFLKPILMAAGMYTFLSLLLSNFTKISLSVEYVGAMFQPSIFLSAIATFLFCSVVTYLTAWFR